MPSTVPRPRRKVYRAWPPISELRDESSSAQLRPSRSEHVVMQEFWLQSVQQDGRHEFRKVWPDVCPAEFLAKHMSGLDRTPSWCCVEFKCGRSIACGPTSEAHASSMCGQHDSQAGRGGGGVIHTCRMVGHSAL